MNWLHFFLWVAGLYVLYYLVMIRFDLAGTAGKTIAGPATQTLTFSEQVRPVQLQQEAAANEAGGTTGNKQAREVISSGGVSLKDLFNLARQEAIIYTNSVSY